LTELLDAEFQVIYFNKKSIMKIGYQYQYLIGEVNIEAQVEFPNFQKNGE